MRVLYLAMSPDGQVLIKCPRNIFFIRSNRGGYMSPHNILYIHDTFLCYEEKIIHSCNIFLTLCGTIADNSNWCRGWDSTVLECFPINESTCKHCDQFQLWFLLFSSVLCLSHSYKFPLCVCVLCFILFSSGPG